MEVGSADFRDIVEMVEEKVNVKPGITDVIPPPAPSAPSTPNPPNIKDTILNSDKKKKSQKKVLEAVFKRPEGMHREVYALLCSDAKDPPALFPSDTSQGYKQVKAKLGRKKVRPWKWTPFSNPARKDGAIFYHWRRVTEEGQDYPFARFNKTVAIPTYSDLEYQMHLHSENWTRKETDHLFELCRRFDLRWVVIHDRFDHIIYKKRSVEDIKERYYSVNSKLQTLRADPNQPQKQALAFNADHERKRKLQLNKLYNRTQEQVKEEEYLKEELRKIESRKKERERKTQDLQKLITAADTSSEQSSKSDPKKTIKKKVGGVIAKKGAAESHGKTPNLELTGIKFPDFKTSGVSLRSQRMKLPSSVGQKKMKAIEQLLEELGIDLYPMPTEEICHHFNELRSDMVLLYELKQAYANCEFELQTLRHRHNALTGVSAGDSGAVQIKIEPRSDDGSPSRQRRISEVIDVVSTTPIRKKRAAAIEASQVVKKLKKS